MHQIELADRLAKLFPRPNAELHEDLREVPFDGARAQEESSADLDVRETVVGEHDDLPFLGGEVSTCLVDAFPHCLARCQELATGTLGECVETHGRERLMSRPQLLARIHSASFAPEPFAVQQARSGQLGCDSGASEKLQRRAVVGLARLAVICQGLQSCLDAERKVRRRGSGMLRHAVDRGGKKVGCAGP